MLKNKIILVFLSVILTNACAVATKNTKVTQKRSVPTSQQSHISTPEEEPDSQTGEESKTDNTAENIEQQETLLEEMISIPHFKPTKQEVLQFKNNIE